MAQNARLAGWGRTSPIETVLHHPEDEAALTQLGRLPSLIARGAGRAYGDAALNRDAVADMTHIGSILEFDPATGIVTAEAGLRLRDLIAACLPQGWFPPVVPGSAEVTLGGMAAADVHGKNHHASGGFGAWLRRLTLLRQDGRITACSREQNADLFAATCGGMGLTGVILTLTIQLVAVPGAALRQETVRARSLDAAMATLGSSEDWPYSVAWIDCLARGDALGRSVIYRARHEQTPAGWRQRPRRRFRVPVDAPSGLLNRWSLRGFNALYYRTARPGSAIVGFRPFFFPLDAIGGWNRLYGRHGFYQHQCVLPLAESRTGLRRLLQEISAAGLGSFLAVLKLMGDGRPAHDPSYRPGPLSFPMRGYTLALDFPATARARALMMRLDAIVREHGGRLYLAKDALQSRDMLQGYPDLPAFRHVRQESPAFRSLLSDRLGL